MRKCFLALPLIVLTAACGQSDEDVLQNAANQSDPAAAAVLNDAAEQGVEPQAALEAAGQAQIANGVEDTPPASLQAKPNLPQDPNRPSGGEAPEKVSTANQAEEHAGHNTE